MGQQQSVSSLTPDRQLAANSGLKNTPHQRGASILRVNINLTPWYYRLGSFIPPRQERLQSPQLAIRRRPFATRACSNVAPDAACYEP